jgi:hypothetical protein
MITIDFECKNQHKFEGCFKDYDAYKKQHDSSFIQCPLCGINEIKRIYTGCSIQVRRSEYTKAEKKNSGFHEKLQEYNRFVKDNFENVGDTFAEKARAIHYGVEEERNIYGKSTLSEVKELIDEGIGILPLSDTEKIIN